jgi:hypothetical protein
MKKLRLSLDALRVESFDVQVTATQRGTVPAHQNTRPDVCVTDPVYCLSDNFTECNSCLGGTCANSCGCGGTYDASCVNGTCPPQCID